MIYRRLHDIPDSWGTAVNIQAMVFGNMGETSATGVAFTRNPSTGEARKLYGEFLINAQGEDVVAGIRTPRRSPKTRAGIRLQQGRRLESAMTECVEELTRIYTRSRSTTATCRTWNSPSRGQPVDAADPRGKRTAKAAMRIAVDTGQ